MSGQFVVIYAGMGVEFVMGFRCSLVKKLHVDESAGTVFESEASGWFAAYRAGLAPWRVRVENLISARDAQALHVSGGNN